MLFKKELFRAGTRTANSRILARLTRGTTSWHSLTMGFLCTALGLSLWGCSLSSGGSGTPRRDNNNEEEEDEDPPGFEVQEGDVVAELEVALPEQESFLLRATLPLPPGLWRPSEVNTPLVVVNPDGLSARTQVVAASRYTRPEDGADVVELLAQVMRPTGAIAGERHRYAVAYVPTEPAELDVRSDVKSLLATEGALQLSTRDVFGNLYTADLWRDVREGSAHMRVLKDGELARQRRTHEVLLPDPVVEGNSGTMPHLMGVHSFLTEWADEDFFSLDLQIHNGFSGLDKTHERDDALQEIYFDELVLRLPEGWHVLAAFPNPSLGTSTSSDGYSYLPLVQGMLDGSLHVMPRQSRFVRRLVIAKETALERARACLEERWLGFATPGIAPSGQAYLSWWNELSARYFPQNHRLPRLDHIDLAGVRENQSDRLNFYRTHVAEGTLPGYPVISEALGWAHPWGVKYGGMTGGDEINFYDGIETAAAASQDGYRLAQLISRMYVDRQRTALFNEDGDPTQVDDWLVTDGAEPYVPMEFFLLPILPNHDRFGFMDAPTFQTQAVVGQGKVPHYQQPLTDYMAVDLQHYVRYTRNLKMLAWLGNDALAKLELEMAAACFYLSYHEYPTHWNGNAQGWGLRAAMNSVAEQPGWGLSFGRGNAWGIDVALAAYAFGNDELRELYTPWFEKVVETVAAGQSTCTGIIQSTFSLKYGYRIMQSFEASIVENALWALRSTVFQGRDAEHADQIQSILETSIYAQIGPLIWRPEYSGPIAWMATGSSDSSEPPYCEVPTAEDAQADSADHTYCWADYAYAYALTSDPIFLEKAREVGNTSDLYQYLHGGGLEGLTARAPLLALMQTLNGE